MANIISIKNVTSIECDRITMDILQDNIMMVTFTNGDSLKFKQYTNGLYCYDTADSINNKTKTKIIDYSLVKTIKNNKKNFKRHQRNGYITDLSRIPIFPKNINTQ